MSDKQPLLDLANRALERWGARDLLAAKALYQEALNMADVQEHRRGDLHMQIAGVLAELNDASEAELHYRAALEHEIKMANGEEPSSVALAKYFLGNHLTLNGKPEDALDVTHNWTTSPPAMQSLLQVVRSRAYAALQDTAMARLFALQALEHAQNEEKRIGLKAMLVGEGLLGSHDG